MKTHILSGALFAGCLAATVSAQTPTLVRGHKASIDKTGTVTFPQPVTSQPPSAPLVGGADSCITPDVIVGAGPFAFDNTVATTGVEGQTEGLCLFFTQTGITNDVWFTWTASATGSVNVSLCGLATMDSKLAIYAGTTCPAPGSALVCDDDFCGIATPSQVTLNVTAGNSYVIQIGNYPTAAPGTGSFTIAAPPPAPINDDCTAPIAISGPGTYPFDNTNATTGTQYTSVCGTIYKDAWWTYTATTGGSATLTTCGFMATPTGYSFDTKVGIYDGVGCPSVTDIACNDDSCAVQGFASTVTWPTTCGHQYTIRLGAYGATYNCSGSFNITENGTACGPVGQPYCFGDGTGTACPCANNGAAGNGCASSVNASGANLTTSGNSLLANDTLALLGTGMPSSSCLYFQGTTQISAAFGDGLRCAGGTVVRLGTKTNVAGASQYPGAGNPSVSVKGGVTAPGTRSYQTWYRNAAAFCTPSTFNLTNGILITWQ